MLFMATDGIYNLFGGSPNDALVITASGSLYPYSNQDSNQFCYYPSIMAVDEFSLMSDRIKIPLRIREMIDEEILFSRKINQQPVDVKNKPVNEQDLPKNAFCEYFRATPNFKINSAAHYNRAAAPLFNKTNPQFNPRFQGRRNSFAQNAPLKRAINPFDDGALKKEKDLTQSKRSDNSNISNAVPLNRNIDNIGSTNSDTRRSLRIPKEAKKGAKFTE